MTSSGMRGTDEQEQPHAPRPGAWCGLLESTVKCSESQTAIVGSLLKARQAFPKIGKTKEGQAGNRRFKYAPLDEVLDAVMPHLYANGLLLTQGTEGNDLVTRLDHISGEWREHRMPINAEHANMQSYGIELTYRRRYAIQPMLGIVTEDDTDGHGAQRRNRGFDHGGQEDEPKSQGAAQNGTEANRQALGGLQPETQDALRRAVPAIVAAAKDNPTQAKFLAESTAAEIEHDDPNIIRMALWALLDSKTRAAIKAAK